MWQIFKQKLSSVGKTPQVGWLLKSEQASIIWAAPKRISPEGIAGQHAKSVRHCPAVIEHEARYFEVPCPIDLSLRIGKDQKTGEPLLINAAGDQSTIRSKHLGQLAVLISRKEWQHPDKPILQIQTPYIFVADDPVYMTQLPPFTQYIIPPWPGVQIGGRFPIHIWPRRLMWAFEWHDQGKELVIKRGDPWFYVRFETENPSRPVRLIEAEMTPQLAEYVTSISAVANYVNRTFSLFDTARARRPKTLLVPKQR